MTNKPGGLNIKAVAERTGIPLHTLRAWERRYGIPRPARVPGNRYRSYREQDIADVLWMKRQVEAGVSPAQASALLWQSRRGVLVPGAASEEPLAEKQTALLTALVHADETGAQRILDEAWGMFPPEQVGFHIIQPAMQEIGSRWLKNEIGVWQEHVASNLIRQRLLAVLQAQPPLPLSAPTLVAACAPEEQHELGLLLLALLLRRQGWHVIYLGQRTPLQDLARAADKSKLVVLSATTVTGLASLIPLFEEANRPAAKLAFGGHLFNELPSLREHLPGVFLGRDAVEAIRELTTANLRAPAWAPPSRALNAARALQAERFNLGWETITHVIPAARQPLSPQHWMRAQALTAPTLFLIDTLVSALAFDVPEVMDSQGIWLAQMLSARGTDALAVKQHVTSLARALEKLLAKEAARQAKPLLTRLLEAAAG